MGPPTSALLAELRAVVGSRVQYCLEQAAVADMLREGVASLIVLYGKVAVEGAGKGPAGTQEGAGAKESLEVGMSHVQVLVTWLRDALAVGARHLPVQTHIVAPLLRLVVGHVGDEVKGSGEEASGL